MEPRFAPAQHALGLACQHMGMLEEAIVEFQNARVCSANHPASTAALAHAYAISGRRPEAEELLNELQQQSGKRRVSSYWVAIVYAGLEEKTMAVRWLEQARSDRDVWLVWLAAEPRFDQLRAEGLVDNLLSTIRPR